VIAYLDSSALVKLVLEEAGSDDVALLWDGADAVLTSRVAYPEARAALAAARRAGRMSQGQHTRAVALWDGYWRSARVIELDDALALEAGSLAEEHALSGFDAVHLASALLVRGDGAILATYDARLHRAAVAEGFAVLPGDLSG
jgi:uncharacterized protein